MATPSILMPQPGVQRDGTRLSAAAWIDGQWARFVNGRPRKMRGVLSLTDGLDGIPRGMAAHASGGRKYLHIGTKSSVSTMSFDKIGTPSAPIVRSTPYVQNDNTLWTFGIRNNPVIANNPSYILAHPGRNLTDIDSSVNTPVYWGNASTSDALVQLANAPEVSGGVVVLHPFVFVYGNAGLVANSDANQPEVWIGGLSNSVNISSQKVVYGARTRGGGQSPAGLFWSLDSVTRATFTGGATGFAYDTITDQSSIISSRAVAEYDGIFIWPGVDRFLTFNGGVREVVNTYATDWFFDNINTAHAQKTFSFVNARWGEIWWCFPFGDATECTHALIYNIRENIWYDTALVGGNRSSAVSSPLLGFPVMGGTDANKHGTFNVWRHEIGTDIVDADGKRPMRSFIQTNDITLLKGDKPSSDAITVTSIELDMLQKGDVRLSVNGKQNARSPVRQTDGVLIPESPTGEGNQLAGLKAEMRQMSFKFESDDVGGDWQLGTNFVHLESGGRRPTG